jgi:hypothetical protein
VETKVLDSLKTKVQEMVKESNLSEIFFAITNVGLDFFMRYSDLNSRLFVPRFVDQSIFTESVREFVLEFERKKVDEKKTEVLEVNQIVEAKSFTELELAQLRLLKVMEDAKAVIEGRKRKFEAE